MFLHYYFDILNRGGGDRNRLPKFKFSAKFPIGLPGGGVLNFELGTDVRPEVSTVTTL